MDNNTEISYEIIEHLGDIRESETGWKREINLVSWNERPAKIDIREWDEQHVKMSRGITITEEEMDKVVAAYLRWKENKQEKSKNLEPGVTPRR